MGHCLSAEPCLLNMPPSTSAYPSGTGLSAAVMPLPFEQMFEDAPFAASLSRRADGRLVAVNQAWEALSGIARDQAIGRSTIELGLWPDATQRQAYLDSLKEQDKPRCTVMIDGRARHLRLQCRRIHRQLIQVRAPIGCQRNGDHRRALDDLDQAARCVSLKKGAVDKGADDHADQQHHIHQPDDLGLILGGNKIGRQRQTDRLDDMHPCPHQQKRKRRRRQPDPARRVHRFAIASLRAGNGPPCWRHFSGRLD